MQINSTSVYNKVRFPKISLSLELLIFWSYSLIRATHQSNSLTCPLTPKVKLYGINSNSIGMPFQNHFIPMTTSIVIISLSENTRGFS